MFYTLPVLRGKVGQPKAINYATGIHSAVSDLEHMLIAFGPDRVMSMLFAENEKLLKREREIENSKRRASSSKQRVRVRTKSSKAA